MPGLTEGARHSGWLFLPLGHTTERTFPRLAGPPRSTDLGQPMRRRRHRREGSLHSQCRPRVPGSRWRSAGADGPFTSRMVRVSPSSPRRSSRTNRFFRVSGHTPRGTQDFMRAFLNVKEKCGARHKGDPSLGGQHLEVCGPNCHGSLRLNSRICRTDWGGEVRSEASVPSLPILRSAPPPWTRPLSNLTGSTTVLMPGAGLRSASGMARDPLLRGSLYSPLRRGLIEAATCGRRCCTLSLFTLSNRHRVPASLLLLRPCLQFIPAERRVARAPVLRVSQFEQQHRRVGVGPHVGVFILGAAPVPLGWLVLAADRTVIPRSCDR